MGFTKADFPPVDPEAFLQQPLMERMKVLALHWVEHGFGSPRMIHAVYVVKLLVFYVLGGVAVAAWTSHLLPFWDVAGWWSQPIVYEKAVLWTVLLETIGVAGAAPPGGAAGGGGPAPRGGRPPRAGRRGFRRVGAAGEWNFPAPDPLQCPCSAGGCPRRPGPPPNPPGHDPLPQPNPPPSSG